LTVLDLLNLAGKNGWQSGVHIKKIGYNPHLGLIQVTTWRTTLSHW